MQLFSLTEKEEDVASHHAKAAHDPVSIKEENTSGSHDNDVPVSKKSEASKSPAVPVASANISRVVPHVTYVLVGAGTASFAAMKVRLLFLDYFVFIA